MRDWKLQVFFVCFSPWLHHPQIFSFYESLEDNFGGRLLNPSSISLRFEDCYSSQSDDPCRILACEYDFDHSKSLPILSCCPNSFQVCKCNRPNQFPLNILVCISGFELFHSFLKIVLRQKERQHLTLWVTLHRGIQLSPKNLVDDVSLDAGIVLRWMIYLCNCVWNGPSVCFGPLPREKSVKLCFLARTKHLQRLKWKRDER